MPLGRVAVFGGRQVHVRELGSVGTPVVLMGGCGLAMEFWRDLTRLLPRGQHVLAYDRPGIGGTPWPGTLPTLDEERATLVDLLESLGTPAVLVAHSMASFHAEAAARTRPELVAGIVMVDGSVEWPTGPPKHIGPTPATLVGKAASNRSFGILGNWLWHLGTWFQSNREFSHLQHGRLPDIYSDADSLAAATAESLAYDRQAWQLIELRREHDWPAGLATLILTAASDSRSGQRWVSSQRRWARMLEARHLLVEDSKHLMMLDRPDVIAAAIASLTSPLGHDRVQEQS